MLVGMSMYTGSYSTDLQIAAGADGPPSGSRPMSICLSGFEEKLCPESLPCNGCRSSLRMYSLTPGVSTHAPLWLYPAGGPLEMCTLPSTCTGLRDEYRIALRSLSLKVSGCAALFRSPVSVYRATPG